MRFDGPLDAGAARERLAHPRDGRVERGEVDGRLVGKAGARRVDGIRRVVAEPFEIVRHDVR